MHDTITNSYYGLIIQLFKYGQKSECRQQIELIAAAIKLLNQIRPLIFNMITGEVYLSIQFNDFSMKRWSGESESICLVASLREYCIYFIIEYTKDGIIGVYRIYGDNCTEDDFDLIREYSCDTDSFDRLIYDFSSFVQNDYE